MHLLRTNQERGHVCPPRHLLTARAGITAARLWLARDRQRTRRRTRARPNRTLPGWRRPGPPPAGLRVDVSSSMFLSLVDTEAKAESVGDAVVRVPPRVHGGGAGPSSCNTSGLGDRVRKS